MCLQVPFFLRDLFESNKIHVLLNMREQVNLLNALTSVKLKSMALDSLFL